MLYLRLGVLKIFDLLPLSIFDLSDMFIEMNVRCWKELLLFLCFRDLGKLFLHSLILIEARVGFWTCRSWVAGPCSSVRFNDEILSRRCCISQLIWIIRNECSLSASPEIISCLLQGSVPVFLPQLGDPVQSLYLLFILLIFLAELVVLHPACVLHLILIDGAT